MRSPVLRRRAATLGATDPAGAAFATCPGPWGLLHLAATGNGLVAIALAEDTAGFAARIARQVGGPVVLDEPGVPDDVRRTLAEARQQLGEYFAGRRRTFELPLALDGLSAWDRLVLGGAASVGYGELASYGELARRIGRRGAARAVGGALGRNPLAIVVPCHRIVAADGTIGGYGGGGGEERRAMLAIKRRLLALEGVPPPPDR